MLLEVQLLLDVLEVKLVRDLRVLVGAHGLHIPLWLIWISHTALAPTGMILTHHHLGSDVLFFDDYLDLPNVQLIYQIWVWEVLNLNIHLR